MKKILIIEDNQTLAKLMSKKIASDLGYEVEVAYKMSEAKLFLKMYEYFVVLTDLNLPDSPDGEIVDYLMKKKIHTIVLTSNMDKKFRENIMKKNIIDYVHKSGVNDVEFIISTIRRLEKNQKHKVLVVDDSMVFRKQMEGMLKNLFLNVYTVAHGEEALGMLEAHPDISLVLTDYNMPVMDGIELTLEIRKKFTKNDLSIIALSSNEDDEINAKFLKVGANDYIKKPFSKEEFSCRVNNTLEAIENIHIITNHANRDYLTGLYNRRYFYQSMEGYMKDAAQNGEKFAVAMIDIDHFKKVNDTYGHDIGDKVIVELSEILRATTARRDLVSRFGGEEFCIVLKNINRFSAQDILERVRIEVQKAVVSTPKGDVEFTISIGAALHDESDSLDDTINNADMMLYKAKQNGRNQVIFE